MFSWAKKNKSKQSIDCTFWSNFPKILAKTGNFIAAESVHNGALIKNQQKEIDLRKNIFGGPKKTKSRQCIDCTFWSNFPK